MENRSNLTTLAVNLGMRYYEERSLLFGRVAGYECAVREQAGKKMMMLHVVAKPSSAQDTQMAQMLFTLKGENEAVTAAVYENFTATLRVNTANCEEVPALVEGLIRRIVQFAKEQNYVPCCSGCGKTKDVRRFLMDEDAKMLCPACRVKAEGELTGLWAAKKFPRHSTVKAFICVLIILLIGATAWVGVYVSGKSATLVGVAMTILSFLAYQYMAGRMKKGSVIGILVGLFLTVFICHNLCVAFELVVAIGQQQETTIMGALFFIPSFLKDPTNREVYFLQLGLSVLAVALSAAPMLWMVYYTWHHKVRLESLEEPTL